MNQEKIKCCKCKDDATNGTTQIEACVSFRFCNSCSELLEHAPTGYTLHNFIGPKKVETLVDKNIREARDRRNRGESPWNK